MNVADASINFRCLWTLPALMARHPARRQVNAAALTAAMRAGNIARARDTSGGSDAGGSEDRAYARTPYTATVITTVLARGEPHLRSMRPPSAPLSGIGLGTDFHHDNHAGLFVSRYGTDGFIGTGLEFQLNSLGLTRLD